MLAIDAVHVVGAFEHPTRRADGLSLAQMHAQVAKGALADAGLCLNDVDGYFCAADAPGLGGLGMAEYMGLNRLRVVDNTETGGSSYLFHIQRAVDAIRLGRCRVALVTMADNQISSGRAFGLTGVDLATSPETPFWEPYALSPPPLYALVAQRHMYQYGTTSEQLAWIKVAASHHAQHNPNALKRSIVTIEEVLDSPMVADPLHRLDCCIMTDGGGAVVLAHADLARELSRPKVRVKGSGGAVQHQNGGRVDLLTSAGRRSAEMAFDEADVRPADMKYASLYDSFTITVLVQIEDLGFCEKGAGGRFVLDGNLISGIGRLPFNTDGGGLCSNHPGNRGGITKLIEAIRQVRGEAHPSVQVRNCDLAVAHGTGGSLAGQHAAATIVFEREG